VHCIDDIENQPFDQPISVTFPTGETIDAGINIRPFAYDCLKKAQQFYQVVVFTASHKSYADTVLDTLEREFKKAEYLTEEERELMEQAGSAAERSSLLRRIKQNQKLFDFRLYRDHCIKTPEGIFIKDLSIIRNRNLATVMIVDNAVYSFGFQLENGIPIIPFYSPQVNPDDQELKHLIYYFEQVHARDDVRLQNRVAFQLRELQQLDLQQQLIIINQQQPEQQQIEEEDEEEEGEEEGCEEEQEDEGTEVDDPEAGSPPAYQVYGKSA